MSATKSRYARPSGVELARLYTELGLSCPDIGWLYERDASTIRGWLIADGIPTRPRGSNAAVHFRKGARSAFAGRKHTPDSIAKVRAATISRGGVPYLRNGQHWLTGQPPEANPRWNGGATPERQEFYRSPEWKAAVRYVWTRDNACCRNCGKDWRTVDRAMEPTFHIHHVWSFQIAALRAHPAILVLLCRECHLWVHSKANVSRAWLPQDSESPFPALADLQALNDLEQAEQEMSTPTLFDTVEAA